MSGRRRAGLPARLHNLFADPARTAGTPPRRRGRVDTTMQPKDTRVAVVGGGVGGLAAAHALAERGFDVGVYEANERFGGKARSVPVSEGPRPLHGEHGFRFFPGYYRHVPATMARIPAGEGTVADRLVETEETLLARAGGRGTTTSTRTPGTPREWLEAVRPSVADDLPAREVGLFLERLLAVATSCRRRREEELDRVSWWEFVDAAGRSRAYRRYLAGGTRPLVALRPEASSARTVGVTYLRLLHGRLDTSRPGERVLDAPSSEAWFDPWIAYLDELGVDLHPGTPARALSFDGRRVAGVTVAGPSGERELTADYYVLALPVGLVPEFVTPGMARAAPELAGIERLATAWMNGIQYYLTEDVRLARGHAVCVDSPWALTAVSQRQFWAGFDVDERGPDEVEGVLSAIVSDWDTPGIRHERPARECTPEEIAEEVWAQLRAHLGCDGRRRLHDGLVHDWFLDPAIVETDDGIENRSPLLVNTVGSLRHRPPAATGIPNLALAGDYVRTRADLASMESADEAGRRAANAVIDRAGGRVGPCELYEYPEPAAFAPLRRQDAIRYRLGLPHPGDVSRSLRAVTRRLRGRP